MTIFQKHQNTAAFQRELYQNHYRRIYNTCLRITGNTMDAEEVMHDVFIKIFNQVDKLNSSGAFVTWSRTIATRMAIDHIRKRTPIFEQVDEQIPIADSETDPATDLTVEAIQHEMNLLPDGYRIVLSMRLLDGCEFHEIARALHIKESTARSQYARARGKLAERLKNKLDV